MTITTIEKAAAKHRRNATALRHLLRTDPEAPTPIDVFGNAKVFDERAMDRYIAKRDKVRRQMAGIID